MVWFPSRAGQLLFNDYVGLLLAELLLIYHFLVVDQQAQSSRVTPVLHTLQTYLLALDAIESKFMLRLLCCAHSSLLCWKFCSTSAGMLSTPAYIIMLDTKG